MNATLSHFARVGALVCLEDAINHVLSLETCRKSCASCDASRILKAARERMLHEEFSTWEDEA